MKAVHLLLLLAVFGAGACGSSIGSPAGASSQGASPSAATPEPSPTASPSATPLPSSSPTDLGQLYLAAVTTFNKTLDAAEKKYNSGSRSLASGKRLFATLAEATLAFIRAVQVIPFTSEFTSASARLITCANQEYVLDRFAATASSSSEFLSYADRAAKKAATCAGDSNELRLALGLAPVQ